MTASVDTSAMLDEAARAMAAGEVATALRLLQKFYPVPKGWTVAICANAPPTWSRAERGVAVQRNGVLYAGGRDWFTQAGGQLHVAAQVNANPAGGQYVLRQTPSHTALVAPRPRRLLPDRPLALIGGSGNYYHWLLDYLPRVPLVADSDLPLIVPAQLATFERDSLAGLGIATGRLLPLPRHGVTHFKRLHVPDLGTIDRRPHPGTVAWLRGTFLCGKGCDRRIWITRGNTGTRRLANEAAIVEALVPLGFRPVALNGMSLYDQAALFAGAEIIAGPHGAGFANAVFAGVGAAMVEVVAAGGRPIFYEALAETLSLRYACVDARPLPTAEQRRRVHHRDWDMVAEPSAVVDAVRRLS